MDKLIINRLSHDLGIGGRVLRWFESYLSSRSSSVSINGILSDPNTIEFGLPQGSLIGPLGFTLYVLPVGRIIRSFEVDFHMYADDIQLYTYFDPKEPSSISSALHKLSCCIDAPSKWMKSNLLKLNDSKTDFFVAVPSHMKHFIGPLSLRVGDIFISPTENIRNLGIVFDLACLCHLM